MSSSVRPIESSAPQPPPGARLLSGLLMVTLVSAISLAMGAAEERLFGRAIIEPLVLAILVGMAARPALATTRAEPGIRFAAREVLEAAVCLLGASMDIPRLFESGPRLAGGIVALVVVALAAGYAIGRAAGLSSRLAILVSCGNAICGNSAIAAVAPVIGADQEDIAAAIALTAVLGVVVVLMLPLLIPVAGLSYYQYGVLAGLTVYAVPQVLAASFAVSVLSGQVATAVKLGRVLMLGPVVTFFALRAHRTPESAFSVRKLVPWFVIGFVVLATLRSTGVIPDAIGEDAKRVAAWLTVGAMAGLGLSVDVRSVGRTGPRVAVAVIGSLATSIVLALMLIRMLGAR